jgi:hypothetical protein
MSTVPSSVHSTPEYFQKRSGTKSPIFDILSANLTFELGLHSTGRSQEAMGCVRTTLSGYSSAELSLGARAARSTSSSCSRVSAFSAGLLII